MVRPRLLIVAFSVVACIKNHDKRADVTTLCGVLYTMLKGTVTR